MIAQKVSAINCTPEPLSNTEYSPINEYKLAPLQRICLDDCFPLSRLGQSVRFEVAQLEDICVVHRFILNEFGNQEPMNRALNITDEDLDESINATLKIALPQNMCILIVDQNVLCGVIINSVGVVDQAHSKKPKIQDDYGKELDTENGVPLKLRQIYKVLDELESFVPNFLPSSCSKYFKVEIISVRPDYAGCGLGKQLMAEGFKLAHAKGFDYCVAICTAVASTKISKSLNLKQVFSFPYNKYKYHGTPVFHKLDGNCESSANLMIGEINEIIQKM